MDQFPGMATAKTIESKEGQGMVIGFRPGSLAMRAKRIQRSIIIHARGLRIAVFSQWPELQLDNNCVSERWPAKPLYRKIRLSCTRWYTPL